MTSTIALSDGRTLAFAEYGDPSGIPLFLFHGTPGSRLLCPDGATARDLHVRLVVTDRPGYGASDAKPGRWLTEWSGDVVALADAIGADRFAVVGWSGGGPHALACAAELPDRIGAVGLIASPGPTDEVPGVMESDEQRRIVYEGATSDRIGTEEFIVSLLEGIDGNDGKRWYDAVRAESGDDPVFTNPGWDANFLDHVVEGFRPGGAGRAEDAVATWGPWGFDVDSISAPTVLFYGERDTNVARVHNDFLASKLTAARTVLWPEETHACIYPRWPEILSATIALL